MGDYKEYLSQLKGIETELESDRMYSRIEAGIARESRRRKSSLKIVLAVLLIGLIAYVNIRPYLNGKAEALADYVYQQEDVGSDPVINYVFYN
jgi:hypothetical protein